MDHWLVDPELQTGLANAGVADVDDLLALGGAQPSVRRFVELPVAGTEGRFHLKCYRYAGWRASKGVAPSPGSTWKRAMSSV